MISHQIHTLLHLRHPSLSCILNPKHSISSSHSKSFIPTSISSKSISLSSLFQNESATHKANHKSKKTLEPLSTEAVELPKSNINNGEDEKEKLKQNLKKLEVELSRYKKDSTKEIKTSSGKFSKPLETLFIEAVGLSEKGEESEIGEIKNDYQESKKGLKKLWSKKAEEPMVFKELSPDMAVFANYLHSKGYLMNANFLPNNKFDVSCFENNYGRDFLKFAAEKFAQDHREISKWLPDSDLQKVAQFGCPSLGRKTVFSAKSMRHFYGIQEETVCNKCMLKKSCKFVNQSVWKKGAKNMDLAVVMRVITLYALDAVPTQLQIPDDIKNIVNRLLKETIRRSEIES